ncbi:MAG: RluA family pseudouridine synthase [Tenericutes bacterium]|jgi:23S rRNA pseudouridine1911/1915/1917 synthase|nr:RluA family pseudouridine synthase [Bacilli bacterium]MDD3995122.1 RluA family pseudouridine synthase [Bacilli bacterium]MDD4623907.1 RluA family pseudouridine synthase [Bacilli bacterium]MDD4831636.1 RluA family pseudouridine synthase [Bacilli bacterium]NLV89980.1 RluA family pseudouridine synthase [Mycoplasmatota bacterium]
MKLISVDEKSDIRIDKYLIDILNISRSRIQKLIEEEKILVNDAIVKSSHIVRVDDEIKIEDIIEETNDVLPVKMNLDIVYEDKYLLVINKPSGMVVHPSIGHYNDTLVNGIMYHYNLSNDNNRAGIVHRIDKDTSGLLLIAKDDDTHFYLSKEIQKRNVNRIYLALVSGVIPHDTGTIDAPIGRDLNDRKKMNVTDVNSKNAITNFKVLKRYKTATLIECKLDTGRTHQIRVHMKYIGYPIINDSVYGKQIINDYGQMLHAKTIGFNHPITKEYMEFSVDAEKEFYEILKKYEEE